MDYRKLTAVLAVCCAVACLVIEGHAQVPPGERGPDDPVWVQWMRPDSADDQTMLRYWQLHKAGELEPEGIVDLGTMLFHRGFPNDAVRMYRQALQVDSRLYEAWFRIGLVTYHLGEMDDARRAYKKCLGIAPDHGWCAFYLGLLEEKTRHPSRALEWYQRAFESAPELADPAVNPELLGSRLYLGALLIAGGGETGSTSRPMPQPDSDDIDAVLSREVRASPAPVVGATSAIPVGAPPPEPHRPSDRSTGGAAGVGHAPTPGTVSPEASLAPLWPTLPEWILAMI